MREKYCCTPPNYEYIAKLCHEANKAICDANGDYSQVHWEDAEEWQKYAAIEGVKYAINNETTPEDQHEAWRQNKIDNGWVYGLTKDANYKTHPCLVPYSELSFANKVKDHVFIAIVNTFK